MEEIESKSELEFEEYIIWDIDLFDWLYLHLESEKIDYN